MLTIRMLQQQFYINQDELTKKHLVKVVSLHTYPVNEYDWVELGVFTSMKQNSI